MIMVDERLYRLRSKDGSHFNEKTNEEQLQAWQFLKDAFNDFTPNR